MEEMVTISILPPLTTQAIFLLRVFSFLIAASGRAPAYGVVAVDPKVIPLGTKLYIEAVDGSWVYGYAVAGDTGGAIKGNKIDLFFNTHAECTRFGRRQAKVYVLQ